MSSIEIKFQTAADGLYEGTLVNLLTFDYIIGTEIPICLSG